MKARDQNAIAQSACAQHTRTRLCEGQLFPLSEKMILAKRGLDEGSLSTETNPSPVASLRETPPSPNRSRIYPTSIVTMPNSGKPELGGRG